MTGTYGYELDLTKLTDAEKELMSKQVDAYHRYYNVINQGDLYRLIMPADCVNGKIGHCAAWMYVSEDKSEALATFVVIRTSIHPVYFLKLQGLDPDAVYADDNGNDDSHEERLQFRRPHDEISDIHGRGANRRRNEPG